MSACLSGGRGLSPTLLFLSPTLLFLSPTLLFLSATLLFLSATLLFLSPTLLFLSPTLLFLSPTLLFLSPTLLFLSYPPLSLLPSSFSLLLSSFSLLLVSCCRCRQNCQQGFLRYLPYQLAKEGREREQPPSHLSYREVKTLIHKKKKAIFHCKTEGYNPNQDALHQLARHQQTTVFRLRTGHCRLNSHLKRIGVKTSAQCPCGEADQIPEHYLQSCSLH